MAFYRTCNSCGAHLDPGERCDCQRDKPVMRAPGKVPLTVKRPMHTRKKARRSSNS